MSLRPIESSMMLSRPPEAVGDKARDMRQTGLNAAAMRQNEEKTVQREINRPQAAEKADNAKIHDENKQNSDTKKDSKKRESKNTDEISKDINHDANERILNLTVDYGKYVRGQPRQIDIQL